MHHAAAVAGAFARLFLLPGDLACNALGVGMADNRDLFRMLINSLVWAAVGAVFVGLVV
jgi:hypothetical protein